MAANKSLATFNLSKEPELQAKKEALAAKQAEAQALVKQLQSSRAKLEAKTGKHRYFSRVKKISLCCMYVCFSGQEGAAVGSILVSWTICTIC